MPKSRIVDHMPSLAGEDQPEKARRQGRLNTGSGIVVPITPICVGPSRGLIDACRRIG
jgi:hypothetical protein